MSTWTTDLGVAGLPAALGAGSLGPGREPRRPVLALSPARGGAGASTLAAACARALARHDGPCVLVDLDADAGGLDVLCGIEDQPGLRWPDLRDATGEVPAAELLTLLPLWGDVPVLSHDRTRPGEVADEAAHDVLVALARDAALVCDTSRAARGRPPLVPDLHVLVVPRDLQAVAAAQTALAALVPGPPTVLVTSGRAPGGLPDGVVADAVGADVVARLRPDAVLPRTVERGAGPCGPALHRTALAVLDELAALAPAPGDGHVRPGARASSRVDAGAAARVGAGRRGGRR